MPYIEINNLTKDYGNGRGVFDLSLSVEKGEAYGFVGINGAGKTTTIRHLMGFLKSDSGNLAIKGLDCWADSDEIKKFVGYVPGEIAFPNAPTGTVFLRQQAELMGLKDISRAEAIMEKLQLDPTANLRSMSKGMKQKTAIAAAFMADPEIVILDEPTTGLDPLMRANFVDILKEEKARGKTIFMSSHMFKELEETCDKVALIREGKIVDVKSTLDMRHNAQKEFEIEFLTETDYLRFMTLPFAFKGMSNEKKQIIVSISDNDINQLTQELRKYRIKFITEIKYTFEAYFKEHY